MLTDACGNDHYEFWTGITINGKTYQSRPLHALCQEFGDAQVLDACMHLGCLPYVEDLSAIRAECQRQEDSYV
jgi:hypothetical protein